MELFLEWGYLGLFLASLIAATLLPMGSELILAGLLSAGLSPVGLLLTATLGNTAGACISYALGYYAADQWIQYWLRISPAQLDAAERRFRRWGLFALCFSWLPVIGDPLTLLAGVLKIRFSWFLLLVGLGKFLRYVAVIGLATTALNQ